MVFKYTDPIDDHYAYTDLLYMQQQEQEMIAEEMHKYKTQAVEKLKSIVHPGYVEHFAAILALGYSEETKEAERIADSLGLSQKHFVAIDGDDDEMRDIMIKERVFFF
jgi:DNA-binding transcriptional regulator LsrR (DeoR family)